MDSSSRKLIFKTRNVATANALQLEAVASQDDWGPLDILILGDLLPPISSNVLPGVCLSVCLSVSNFM